MEHCLFLTWESPYPPHSGASLRSIGLLRELSRFVAVHSVVLSRRPLSGQQLDALNLLSTKVTRVPLEDSPFSHKTKILSSMVRTHRPYHCAVLEHSLASHSETRHQIINCATPVFTSVGHWGTLISDRRSPNWILNQCDADVEFWRIYASLAASPFVKMTAILNWLLAREHFPRVYRQVGRIVSVCEEDRMLTMRLAPHTPVDVIENGIDCTLYVPHRQKRAAPRRLLFTGTSAARNMVALRRFVHNVWPLVRRKVPGIELLVAGDFSVQSQSQFAMFEGVRFTGRVDDIRPFFDQCDVYIAPFRETHGSKLKIAEAMAMAMPIVSTPQGIRGYALEHDRSVLVAHSDREFAEHILSLLADPPRCLRLGTSAREVAAMTIDWRVLGKRLQSIIESVQKGTSP